MKKVSLKYIDFSHGFAYDTLTRPVQTVLNAVAAGETDEKTLMEGFMKGLGTATKEARRTIHCRIDLD